MTPGRDGLALAPEWTRRWTATWRTAGDEVSCTVRDLAHTRIADGTPMRWFSWRRAQRHRPGLQFLVSTGRHHGAESLEEARLLQVLDFAADLVDVLSQPERLRFDTATGRRGQIPDFLGASYRERNLFILPDEEEQRPLLTGRSGRSRSHSASLRSPRPMPTATSSPDREYRRLHRGGATRERGHEHDRSGRRAERPSGWVSSTGGTGCRG